MMSDRLSEHFTWAEATRSSTADRLGIINLPDDAAREAIKDAAALMEAIRSLVARPIEVTSWYRSPEVNHAVGGSATSDHMTGYAVDFRVRGLNAWTAARMIITSPLMFDQLIWYPPGHPNGQTGDRLHISAAPANRREVLTRNRGNSPMYAQGLSE
jgi:zinc D-Ala-D-Ala carboxypeptidase